MLHDLPSLAAMRRYLTNQGWSIRSAAVDGLDIFAIDDPDFGEMQLVLPVESSVADTDRRVEQALRTVADMRERSFDTIAEEVNGIGFDLIEAALPSPKVYSDSVSLRVADTLVRTSRALLRNAAFAEYDASQAERPRHLGHAYADACRFGHTFRGSFGFRILSLVGPHDHSLIGEDDTPPPERRIVQRLTRGLRAAEAAAKNLDPAPLVLAARQGLLAGGCYALAQLLDRSESDAVTFKVSFSPEWRPPADLSNNAPMLLPAGAASVIREAGRQLLARMPTGSTSVEGRVVRLSSRVSPADLLHPEGREIGIEWQSEDHGDVTVRVRLSPSDYLLALEAHRMGYDVSARGIIEAGAGGAWHISRAEDFRVTDEVTIAA